MRGNQPLCTVQQATKPPIEDLTHKLPRAQVINLPSPREAIKMQQQEGDNTSNMQPEFGEHTSMHTTMEQMFQAMSMIMIQVNHTNQALMTCLTSQSQSTGTISDQRKDSRIRPRSFSCLPTEDVLAWLDHFDLVVGYHDWNDERKALELQSVLEHLAATWFIQQSKEIKNDWHYLREKLIQHFANNDVTQSTLQ